MRTTRKNRKFAIVALASAAFAAPAWCGLAGQANASVVVQSIVPTIAPDTIDTSSPWISTGGFSSSYNNTSTLSTGTYGPANLFSHGLTSANIGTAITGSQFAASGISPTHTGTGTIGAQNDLNPVVSTDYGTSVSANALVYAQRDSGLADQVTQVNVWFLSAPFTETFTAASGSPYTGGTGSTPGTETVPTSNIIGSESITITDSGVGDNTNLNEYTFPDSATLTGRYVVVQFIGVDPGTGTNTTTVANPGGLAFALALDSSVPEPSVAALGMSAMGLIGLRRRRRA